MNTTLKNLKESIGYTRELGKAFGLQAATFFAVLIPFVLFITQVFIPKFSKLTQYKDAIEQIQRNPQGASMADVQQIKQLVDAIQNYLIITIIVAVLLYLLFKGLVWWKISNKKFTWKKLGEFAASNMIISVAIFLLGTAFFFLFRAEAFLFLGLPVVLFLLFHSLGVYNSAIMEKGFVKSFRELFRMGYKKIHYFLIPHAILLVVFIVISFLMLIVGMNLDFLFGHSLIFRRIVLVVLGLAFLILYLAFFVWQKNYMYVTLKSLKK